MANLLQVQETDVELNELLPAASEEAPMDDRVNRRVFPKRLVLVAGTLCGALVLAVAGKVSYGKSGLAPHAPASVNPKAVISAAQACVSLPVGATAPYQGRFTSADQTVTGTLPAGRITNVAGTLCPIAILGATTFAPAVFTTPALVPGAVAGAVAGALGATGATVPTNPLKPTESIGDGNPCMDTEEEFAGLCYAKCSQLTGVATAERKGPWTCCKSNCDDALGFMDWDVNMDYASSNEDGSGASAPHIPGTCLTDEEMYLGECYAKCATLTKNAFPYRVSAVECCKVDPWEDMTGCWDPDSIQATTDLAKGGGEGDGDPSTPSGPHAPDTALTR